MQACVAKNILRPFQSGRNDNQQPMSLKNRLVRQIWWLGWDLGKKGSISRLRNARPGLHTEQMRLSFPISDRSSLCLQEALECHALSNSRVSSSLVCEMRVSWVTLLSSIPSSFRVVQGTTVFGVWIKAEIRTSVERESGAGGHRSKSRPDSSKRGWPHGQAWWTIRYPRTSVRERVRWKSQRARR